MHSEINFYFDLVREHAGTLTPWAKVPLNVLQDIFVRVYPDVVDYVMEEKDILYTIVSLLLVLSCGYSSFTW